jgi:class 3 adenylate cyclase
VWLDSDVRHILGSIQAATLVMHGSVMDVNESRCVAKRIPRATLLEFPEVETVAPVFGDAERPIQAMHAFISDVWDDAERQSRPDRVLATVLFTDLVGSTEQAVALGPDWQEQMRKHNSTIRRELAHFRGREIDSAGDGFFASGFDGPAQAIRCGCAIRDAIEALGLPIRVGVHRGECDIVDGKLAGESVFATFRVADA